MDNLEKAWQETTAIQDSYNIILNMNMDSVELSTFPYDKWIMDFLDDERAWSTDLTC